MGDEAVHNYWVEGMKVEVGNSFDIDLEDLCSWGWSVELGKIEEVRIEDWKGAVDLGKFEVRTGS